MGLYVLDFDSTAGKVRKETDEQMLEIISLQSGVDRAVVDKALPDYLQAHNGAFSIEGFLRTLKINAALNFDFVYNRTKLLIGEAMKSADILYPDTLPVVKRLLEDEHHVCVLTHGGADYQKLKLESSGLQTYLTQYSITEQADEKPDVMEVLVSVYAEGDASNVTFVDDRLANLTGMREVFPAMNILHMQRQPHIGSSAVPEVATEGEFKVVYDLLSLL